MLRLDCFNSIKVRLRLEHSCCSPVELVFQFHKGAIKTVTLGKIVLSVICFNSIKVRLRLILVNFIVCI